MTADEKQLDEQLEEVRHAVREAKDAAQEVRDSRPDPMGSGAQSAASGERQEDTP
jgi:hypothetical protein